MDKKKHFSCKNCNKTCFVNFKNNVVFCSGLVKIPNPKCDKYRFCMIKGNSKDANDIMIEELMALVANLSQTYILYLTRHPVTKPKDQKRKK